MTTNDDAARVTELADADLVLRTRSGDSDAFGELWRRHYRSGIAVARSVSFSLDADDLVQEAYTRIYQSIQSGGGPTGSFRAYLFTSIRNTAAGWGRARKETPIDVLDTVEDPATSEQATSEALDRSLTHQAFRSLPTRWQEVLWYSEIERMKPAEIAPLLGLKPTAVAQLTFRAREGLREAWIQAHLRSLADGSDCQWTVERLGAYARNNLGPRDQRKVDAHLAECARCAIVASEAQEVGSRLALVLLPLTIGAAGSAGYLAMLQGGGVPIIALAAMPGSIQGAVTVAPAAPVPIGAGTAGASGAGAGSAGTAGAGTAAAGTAAAAAGASGGAVAAGAAAVGGGFIGVGATLALATAGLVVVGSVVAAAVVLPTLSPSVADDTGTSLVQQGPAPVQDETTDAAAPPFTEAPLVGPDAEGEPVAPPPVVPPRADQTTPVTNPVVPAPPASQPTAPVVPADGTDPTDPVDPTDPTDPTDPVDPTDPIDPVDPTLPEGMPSVGEAVVSFEGTRLTIAIPVTGAAGSTVQVSFAERDRGTMTLDASGAVSLTLRPTVAELLSDPTIHLRYTAGALSGPESTIDLHDLVSVRDILDALGI